ncbi:MAG: nucleotidyltransferase family protein, partial [Pyramidobacter sp.]
MDKIVGITAEYNPFHHGHLYQIRKIRSRFPEAGIMAVLSTSFLQRGVPALMDKWRRAKAAVLCGADLVLELPLPFCCNNAGVFASAAVALMKATGVVNAISFGMESSGKLLCTVSDILVQEVPAFKFYLQKSLKSGFSYAEARSRAIETLCPGAAELTRKPNNTLAVAYAEAVKRQKADLELLPVPRCGAGYYDLSEGPMMSAQGIREALTNGRKEQALQAMPEASAEILREALASGQTCDDTKFLWQHLRLLLTRLTPEELSHTAGISEGVEHRLLQIFSRCGSFEDLAAAAATRRYPKSRIRRQLMALLLNISADEDRQFQRRGPAYIRPLAMNARGRQMLRAMQGMSSLPVITKPAALHDDSYAQSIMALEFRGAAIWQSLTARPDFDAEKKATPWIAD